jgi:TPR repeat protein
MHPQQGDASAQYNLDLLYSEGKGVPQSYERAAELWQQAAAQGYAKAQYNLSALYCNGQGVPQDVARGVALFKQAAAGGIKHAADFLRTLGEAVPPGAPVAAGAPQPMD